MSQKSQTLKGITGRIKGTTNYHNFRVRAVACNPHRNPEQTQNQSNKRFDNQQERSQRNVLYKEQIFTPQVHRPSNQQNNFKDNRIYYENSNYNNRRNNYQRTSNNSHSPEQKIMHHDQEKLCLLNINQETGPTPEHNTRPHQNQSRPL